MYPFSIRSSIPLRSNVDRDELHALLMRGVNGRKITRIRKNHYQMEEPVSGFQPNASMTKLVHEIYVTPKTVNFVTSSPAVGVLVVISSVLAVFSFFYFGFTKGLWDFGILVALPVLWYVLPAFFYFSYLFAKPFFKELEKRICKL